MASIVNYAATSKANLPTSLPTSRTTLSEEVSWKSEAFPCDGANVPTSPPTSSGVGNRSKAGSRTDRLQHQKSSRQKSAGLKFPTARKAQNSGGSYNAFNNNSPLLPKKPTLFFAEWITSTSAPEKRFDGKLAATGKLRFFLIKDFPKGNSYFPSYTSFGSAWNQRKRFSTDLAIDAYKYHDGLTDEQIIDHLVESEPNTFKHFFKKYSSSQASSFSETIKHRKQLATEMSSAVGLAVVEDTFSFENLLATKNVLSSSSQDSKRKEEKMIPAGSRFIRCYDIPTDSHSKFMDQL